ncbi:hypothetical protein DFJ73DRAFT_875674 [Zopfochytrium polystomum]|nr:hypothetical protein DFJ73DRAFT_875674 [Zopfochytrium polystomum]
MKTLSLFFLSLLLLPLLLLSVAVDAAVPRLITLHLLALILCAYCIALLLIILCSSERHNPPDIRSDVRCRGSPSRPPSLIALC